MRPVNLIPPEDRRGDQAPLRTGPLVYILLGTLVLALFGIVAMVLTDNQIAGHKSEVAKLESEDAAAIARVSQLIAYTEFRELSAQRVATVQSLADSRFDWERVMRELALIVPSDVSLVDLNASSAPGGESSGSEGGNLVGGVAGPSLQLSGCAAGHHGVARFITALKDIEGVTRVGVESSVVTDEGGESTGGGESAECSAGVETADFSLTVAFDAAPVPATGEGEATATETAPESSETSTSETGEGG